MLTEFETWLATDYAPIAGGETPEGGTATAPPEEPAAPPPPVVDLEPLTSRMDEVLGRVGSLEQRIPEPTPEPPEAPPEPDWSAQMPGDPNDPNYIAGVLRAEAQRVARETMQPEIQRLQDQRTRDAEDRRTREASEFIEDYPELQQRETAQALVNDAQQWAQDIVGGLAANGVDPQLAQAIVGEPAFLELVHLAAKTAERAEGENTPGQGPGQGEVTLEGGGAPNAGAAGAAQPLGAQIKEAGAREGMGFWTG